MSSRDIALNPWISPIEIIPVFKITQIERMHQEKYERPKKRMSKVGNFINKKI